MESDAAYRGKTRSGKEQSAPSGMRDFVQESMTDGMAISNEAIQKGFEQYMQHVRCERNVYETIGVERAWTRILTELPNARHFSIGLCEYEHISKPENGGISRKATSTSPRRTTARAMQKMTADDTKKRLERHSSLQQ